MTNTNNQVTLNNQFLNACLYGTSNEVKHFLDQGADVNSKHKNGKSALQAAFHYSDVKKIEVLCNHKDISKEQKTNALIGATFMYNAKIVKALIEGGAYINENYFNLDRLNKVAADAGITLPIGAAA